MKVDQFLWPTRKPVHLICKKAFIAERDVQIEAADYNGFTVRSTEGITHTFLLLRPIDADYDAIDVTTEAAYGGLIMWDRSKPAA